MNRPKAPTTDFGHLAKRITRWTSNALASAIVVLICLGFGHQVLDWSLNPVEPPTVQPTANPAGVLNSLQGLEFGGDNYSLRRQFVTGDKLHALAWIREACREVLKSASGEFSELTEAEQAFLDRTATAYPSEQMPGRWQLFVFDDGFPLAVGVRRETAEVLNSEMIVQGRRRMNVWAMAVPMGRNHWSMYVYRNGPPAPGSTSSPPLPPHARQTLALRCDDGGDMIGFTGDGDADAGAWRRFFDQTFARRSFRRHGAWRQTAAAWHARYESSDNSGRVFDVQFGPTARGEFVGLLSTRSKVSPPSRDPAKASN